MDPNAKQIRPTFHTLRNHYRISDFALPFATAPARNICVRTILGWCSPYIYGCATERGPACVADQRSRYKCLVISRPVLFEANQSRLFVIILVINMRVLASYQIRVPDVCSAHRCRPSGYRPSFEFRVPAGQGFAWSLPQLGTRVLMLAHNQ